jgi:hypothetical protein
MQPDRSKVLTETLRVKSSEVSWHFTADYYDGPISGLAFFRKHLHRFCCFQEDIPLHYNYVLQELTPDELTEELRIKAKFETLVGTHCSFDETGNPLPRVVRSAESAQRFYSEEKFDRRADPFDRPVVAWFDTAKSDKEA